MLANVLETAEKHGIKTSITLNTPNITSEDALAVYTDYQNLFPVDYLTTTSGVASVIKSHFPSLKIICSYNEAITNYNELYGIVKSDLFDGVVIGNRFFRDKKAFEIVKDGGKKTILLVNNGCSPCCNSFCKKSNNYCLNLFNQELLKYGAEQMYSRQSIFPEELVQFEQNNFRIDQFKLSSRPITYNELDCLLSSYISLESKTYVSSNIYNYHLYARLGHFSSYYSSFDYDRIVDQKKELWKSLYGHKTNSSTDKRPINTTDK